MTTTSKSGVAVDATVRNHRRQVVDFKGEPLVVGAMYKVPHTSGKGDYLCPNTSGTMFIRVYDWTFFMTGENIRERNGRPSIYLERDDTQLTMKRVAPYVWIPNDKEEPRRK